MSSPPAAPKASAPAAEPGSPSAPGPGGAPPGRVLGPRGRLLAASLLLALAALARLPHLEGSAFDFHPVRQYRAALIASGFAGTADEGRPAVGEAWLERNRLLEPPLAELVTSAVWRAAGERSLLVPRLLSTVSWLLGALALHAFARRLVGPDAAFASSAFFLLAPFAPGASTSFQPDPAMVALVCGSLLALERLARWPGRSAFGVAAAACALAVLVKPVSLFLLAGGGVARFSAARARGGRGGLVALARDGRAWMFALLALAPTAAWYAWGTFVAGFLEAQAAESFRPELLLEPAHWRRLGRIVAAAAGVVPLAAAAIGLAVAPPLARRWLAGLALGYALYVAAFTHHTATHDYYHLQLLVPVALGLGALAARLLALLPRRRPVLAAGLWIGLLVAGGALGTSLAARRLRPAVAEFELPLAAEIGAVLGGSTRVVTLANDLSKPLQFHGGFASWNWPWSPLIEAWRRAGRDPGSPEERLLELTGGEWPDWFCVAQTRELKRQPELAAWLAGFPVARRDERWILYDLRNGGGTGER